MKTNSTRLISIKSQSKKVVLLGFFSVVVIFVVVFAVVAVSVVFVVAVFLLFVVLVVTAY